MFETHSLFKVKVGADVGQAEVQRTSFQLLRDRQLGIQVEELRVGVAGLVHSFDAECILFIAKAL